ncbi:MAG: hypothetical protein RLZZ253_752 [Verrucomicrobiota bacterium]|jgi:predicted RNA-binding protein YlqC (UPF0109 family)
MAEPQIEAFLRYTVEGLVDHPSAVTVSGRWETATRCCYRVEVHPEDVGKVIGKQGQTITALRNLIQSAAERIGQEAVLDLVEDGGRRP